MTLPALQVCEQACASRDPRFDGMFVVGAASTGVYCRPVCPAPSPKPENVRYYPAAATAEAAGLRPCRRCRPELPPSESWRRGAAHVGRALQLIEDGFLAESSVRALSERVGVGERQLRRQFVERLGTTPTSVHSKRRLISAKRLLEDTSMSILDVALESGFSSLRRFNACFRDAYGLPPSAVRREPHRAGSRAEVFTLLLDYRAPYDFGAQLEELRAGAIAGLEEVGAGSYTRAFGPEEQPGWLRVSRQSGHETALRLEVQSHRPTRIPEIVGRLRRMFDLDADPRVIGAALSEDPVLRPSVEARPGLRLCAGWDGFEVAVRSVLACTVGAAGRQTLARLVDAYGSSVDLPSSPGPARLFPSPDSLADADLVPVGVSETDAGTVRGIARALLEGRVAFGNGRALEDFVADWTSLPGVHPQIAHGIALGALGHPDAFPVCDMWPEANLGTPRGRSEHYSALRTERWRPWRAYALLHLRHAANAARQPSRTTSPSHLPLVGREFEHGGGAPYRKIPDQPARVRECR